MRYSLSQFVQRNLILPEVKLDRYEIDIEIAYSLSLVVPIIQNKIQN